MPFPAALMVYYAIASIKYTMKHSGDGIIHHQASQKWYNTPSISQSVMA